jgi:hypothetical protein
MALDTTFFGGLRIASVQWSLNRALSENTLRDGTVIANQVGTPKWMGAATLSPAYHADLAEVEALLAKLTAPGEYVLAHDPRYSGPKADPGGVTLGAATPTIHTLNADNKRLRVTGLPSGYVLSPGDYIGWTYLSNPTRYALHRLVTGATASGAGLTPLFEVTPHIAPGVTTGAAVTLVRPAAKCLIRAQYGAGVPLITNGGQIELIQTTR